MMVIFTLIKLLRQPLSTSQKLRYVDKNSKCLNLRKIKQSKALLKQDEHNEQMQDKKYLKNFKLNHI
jgi:hypothetical protein